ncbi:trace amine-associated receptor 13c-like protein [Lates japonicus]|uniref:Trace amine-associated receptor 13c-like protein n=1 Tax=Lates japonicus TaxID=270547 RepID=A0AAD3RBX2_LATJO|nr:trace amine-associated receptor 13c-like protein [Lates japonicus]
MPVFSAYFNSKSKSKSYQITSIILQYRSETALLYALLAFVSLLTVTLNLLVIVSISHFRQLHTPTNALLLSLAVSDLVVGLMVMPIEGLRYMETCWLLGRLMCALTPYVSYCLLSASLGNMVLISIDRYLAICDPLLYSSKITVNRVKINLLVLGLLSVYNGPPTLRLLAFASAHCDASTCLPSPISHFRQPTPTNALPKSLAVSDLVVGLLGGPSGAWAPWRRMAAGEG